MVKGVILAFRAASNARDVVAWCSPAPATRLSAPAATPRNTPSTTRATRRNTAQYMRLFNDMVSSILACDKPVICRVNGMRIGGGQEIGMACDFTIAQDLARFGQAGPKHGSAAIGGATDFLPVMIGCERAMECVHALRAVVRAQGLPPRHDHRHRPGAESGRQVHRQSAGRDGALTRRIRPHRVTASPRPARRWRRARRCWRAAPSICRCWMRRSRRCAPSCCMTFPECTDQEPSRSCASPSSTPGTRNKENTRAWLALNMMTEAQRRLPCLQRGAQGQSARSISSELRQRLAKGEPWTDALTEELLPKA